jgi:hypothetical protein
VAATRRGPLLRPAETGARGPGELVAKYSRLLEIAAGPAGLHNGLAQLRRRTP